MSDAIVLHWLDLRAAGVWRAYCGIGLRPRGGEHIDRALLRTRGIAMSTPAFTIAARVWWGTRRCTL